MKMLRNLLGRVLRPWIAEAEAERDAARAVAAKSEARHQCALDNANTYQEHNHKLVASFKLRNEEFDSMLDQVKGERNKARRDLAKAQKDLAYMSKEAARSHRLWLLAKDDANHFAGLWSEANDALNAVRAELAEVRVSQEMQAAE